jgi:hypothetical protein
MRLTEKPTAEATELEALIKKELDAVIGDRFVEKAPGSARQRLGRTLARWAIGALLAITAASVIALVLHTHLTQAPGAPAPGKPVEVRILPPQK